MDLGQKITVYFPLQFSLTRMFYMVGRKANCLSKSAQHWLSWQGQRQKIGEELQINYLNVSYATYYLTVMHILPTTSILSDSNHSRE